MRLVKLWEAWALKFPEASAKVASAGNKREEKKATPHVINAVRIVPKNGARAESGAEDTCQIADFPHEMWSRLGDLNPGPTHYECVALPLS